MFPEGGLYPPTGVLSWADCHCYTWRGAPPHSLTASGVAAARKRKRAPLSDAFFFPPSKVLPNVFYLFASGVTFSMRVRNTERGN